MADQSPHGYAPDDARALPLWQAHDSDVCPVPLDTAVEVRFASGEVDRFSRADAWDWERLGHSYDIAAYRVLQ